MDLLEKDKKNVFEQKEFCSAVNLAIIHIGGVKEKYLCKNMQVHNK